MPAGLTRFSSSARRVLSLAHEEAFRMGNIHIRPGHILIGLIQDKGEAGQILAGQGANLEAVRKIVIEQTPDSEKSGPHPGRIDLLGTTQKLLEQAVRMVRQYQHGMISSEHLLLALVDLEDQRTQTFLGQAGLDRESIRELAQQSLATQPPSTEFNDLLYTLEKFRHLLAPDLTPEDANRLDRIESILREHFHSQE